MQRSDSSCVESLLKQGQTLYKKRKTFCVKCHYVPGGVLMISGNQFQKSSFTCKDGHFPSCAGGQSAKASSAEYEESSKCAAGPGQEGDDVLAPPQ